MVGVPIAYKGVPIAYHVFSQECRIKVIILLLGAKSISVRAEQREYIEEETNPSLDIVVPVLFFCFLPSPAV